MYTYTVERCITPNSTPREYAPMWERLTDEQVIARMAEYRRTPESRDGVRITRSDGKHCITNPYGEIVVSE